MAAANVCRLRNISRTAAAVGDSAPLLADTLTSARGAAGSTSTISAATTTGAVGPGGGGGGGTLTGMGIVPIDWDSSGRTTGSGRGRRCGGAAAWRGTRRGTGLGVSGGAADGDSSVLRRRSLLISSRNRSTSPGGRARPGSARSSSRGGNRRRGSRGCSSGGRITLLRIHTTTGMSRTIQSQFMSVTQSASARPCRRGRRWHCASRCRTGDSASHNSP